MPYTFPGTAPFVESACDRTGLADAEQRHRARTGWHIKSIGDALSQLPHMAERAALGQIPAGACEQALDRAALIRNGLAAQLEACDMAIVEAATALGLPIPAECLAPEPDDETESSEDTDDGSERLRSADDPSVGNHLVAVQGRRARRRARQPRVD